eukprot:9351280-Alexandrium_andersonii.AAC.1
MTEATHAEFRAELGRGFRRSLDASDLDLSSMMAPLMPTAQTLDFGEGQEDKSTTSQVLQGAIEDGALR